MKKFYFIILFIIQWNVYAQNNKPNVLFIAVDDLRPELGCYGYHEVKSPTIDQLANTGVMFTRAYCQIALCGPSRASLMTSCYPDRLNVYNMSGNDKDHWNAARPSIVTLPEQFRKHGYFSRGFGKIYDNRLGLDEEKSWDQFTQGWRTKFVLKENKDRKAPYEGEQTSDDTFTDGNNAKLAVEFINAYNDKRPFFLAFGLNKPHLPFVAPKKYWDLYNRDSISLPVETKKPLYHTDYTFSPFKEIFAYDVQKPITQDVAKELRHGYFACISYIDAQINRVLDALEAKGVLDNTIIVLWGDHGFKLGEYNEWAKATNLELDTRVPLILRLPGSQQMPQTCNALVELTDVLPTICEAAGIPVPESAMGSSLMPILNGNTESIREYAFFQYSRSGMAYSVRTPKWHYTEQINNGKVLANELYQLNDGTIQHENVLRKYPEVVIELSKLLKQAILKGQGKLAAPPAPKNLSASDITNTRCQLTWEASADVISYDVYINGIYDTTVVHNGVELTNLSSTKELRFAIKQRNMHGMLSSLSAEAIVNTFSRTKQDKNK